MSPLFEHALVEKAARRRRLRALSYPEKVRIVEQMRAVAWAIRAAAGGRNRGSEGDSVAMKHRAQERIARETKGMSDEELIEYFNRGGREFRETGRIPGAELASLVVHEEPPGSGAGAK